jgi:hypothetical protein
VSPFQLNLFKEQLNLSGLNNLKIKWPLKMTMIIFLIVYLNNSLIILGFIFFSLILFGFGSIPNLLDANLMNIGISIIYLIKGLFLILFKYFCFHFFLIFGNGFVDC